MRATFYYFMLTPVLLTGAILVSGINTDFSQASQRSYNHISFTSETPTPFPTREVNFQPSLESSTEFDVLQYQKRTLDLPSVESVVLYDQTDEPDITPPTGINSQNWETSMNQFDIQAADDFVVPLEIKSWNIERIELNGFYRGATERPAESVNVFVYEDDNGFPGDQIYEGIELEVINGLETGNFVIDFTDPLVLEPGHFWISVQANLDFFPDNQQWFWQKREIQNFNESVLRNPGDGFQTGCKTWAPRMTVCGSTPGPDFLFSIFGESEPIRPPLWTRSLYINTYQPADLDFMGRTLGGRATDGIAILSYGKPDKRGEVQGTFLIGGAGFASLSKSSEMTEAFITGWWRGLDDAQKLDPELDPFLVVVVGTSNCGARPGVSAEDPIENPCYPSNWNVSIEHGYAWAKMVDELNEYVLERRYQSNIMVVAGSDIELAWNNPRNTKEWIEGYKSYFAENINRPVIRLFDFGDCGDCKYASRDGTICTSESCKFAVHENTILEGEDPVKVTMYWHLDDVLFKAFGSGISFPIPEIYEPDRPGQVSGTNAIQWYGLSRYAVDTISQPIDFHGVLTQYARKPTTNKPEEGWWQLYDMLASDSLTAQHFIPWLTDIEYISYLTNICFDC